jgi:hypothetical protein
VKVASWLASSIADAEARGLPQLVPLLETLARSTDALRAADAEFGHPAMEVTEATNTMERAEAAGTSEHDDR